MGQFIVHVDAVGNHGCERHVKDGEKVSGCGLPNCVDCITRKYLAELRSSGAAPSPSTATITHWPGQLGQVTDNLISGVRTGSF